MQLSLGLTVLSDVGVSPLFHVLFVREHNPIFTTLVPEVLAWGLLTYLLPCLELYTLASSP